MTTETSADAPAKTSRPKRTVLCLASYFKGTEFLEQCHAEGCEVVLLTLESLLDKPWPRSILAEVYGMPSFSDLRKIDEAVSFLAQTRVFDRIAPLDDYDVELTAHLREHLRIPGMGESTARYFRDKLAMRERAKDRGIRVPEFVHALNDDAIRRFARTVPGPWLLKPRSEASAVGIRKLHDEAEMFAALAELGPARSHHLIERMVPGDVFHVDSLVVDREILLAEVHQYRRPLLQIWQKGGIFSTRTVRRGSELQTAMLAENRKVLDHLGLVRGATHTEFIRDENGAIHFLETAARVGGVHISDLVEASTGLNLWREWARIELDEGDPPYALPAHRADYAGLIVSLARQEHPDTSSFDDPEIVWRLQDNPHHIGMIVRADNPERIEALLDEYEARIGRDFTTSMPPLTAPAG